jgi:hypothetical protein
MTAPPAKFAVISMIGPEGKAGAQMLASEGTVVAAYRVVTIHADRVVFERDGHTFFVRVGTEPEDPLTPTTPYVRKGTASLRVVAPPANIEEIRRRTEVFVELLKANPEFQKRVDERLRRLRESGGASQ